MFSDHKLGLQIAQFAEDRRQWEVDLRRAFPAIRFLVPPAAYLPRARMLTFVESLLDPPALERGAAAWILPSDDWAPLWGPRLSPEDIVCLNEPRFAIAMTWLSRPQRLTCWRPLRDSSLWEMEVEIESISESMIFSSWAGEDEERARFVRKAFRLARKGATNRLLSIDLATGRPKRGATRGGVWWVAPHAAAWLRAAPTDFSATPRVLVTRKGATVGPCRPAKRGAGCGGGYRRSGQASVHVLLLFDLQPKDTVPSVTAPGNGA